MKALRDLANYFKSYDVEQTATFALQQIRDETADLIRDQMMQGKRGDGSNIEPSYRSRLYASRKQQTPGRGFLTPNLKDTGDFHGSVRLLTKRKGKYLIEATDEKTKMLLQKYDEPQTLLTLTDNNKEITADKLKKLIIDDLLEGI